MPLFTEGNAQFYALSLFFSFSCCSYLIASMGLQVIWSFVLAVLDAYALVRKKVLHNPVLVSLFVVGDWVSLYETLIKLNCFISSKRLVIIVVFIYNSIDF